MKQAMFRFRQYFYFLVFLAVFLPQIALAQEEAAPVGFLGAIEAAVQRVVDGCGQKQLIKTG